MAERRNSRGAIVVGCIALVGIVWAGLNIVRQLKPRSADAVDPAIAWAQAQAAAQERSRQLLAKVPAPVERTKGPAGRIVPAHFAWQNDSGGGGLLDAFDGCLPAGPGVDIVWDRGNLFLMKQKGRLTPVWAADGANDHFSFAESGGTSVCFDGRYVWAALTRHQKNPLLVVLDPQSGKTWTLGAEDGLPSTFASSGQPMQIDGYLAVGPVEPGKAFIAASGGSPALALVEFDPMTGASVKAISPAAAPQPNAPDSKAAAQAAAKIHPPNVKPVAVVNLSLPASPGKKSLCRMVISGGMHTLPQGNTLLVDPEKLTWELASNDGIASPINNRRIAVHDGAFYWVNRLPTEPPKVVFTKATLPKLEEEFLFDDMPEGKPVSYNGRLVFLGDKCWLWQPGEKQLASVEVDVPWSFRSDLGIQPAAPARKIAGEEWELDEVFPSQHYGALVKARKKIGSNSYTGIFKFFQFALADDPRIAPEEPAEAARTKLAIDLPAGTAASELKLYAPEGGERPPQASLGKVVEASADDKLRYPVLAREIVRQSLLIAARNQLQWSTRDGTLSEDLTADREPAANFVLATRFPYGGEAEFGLHSVDREGKSIEVWQDKIVLNEDEETPLDYARLVAAAERWSRDAFPALLEQHDLHGQANPLSEDAAVSPAASEWLKQMTFTAQFAVLRDLHHTIRHQGEADELLGALVRSYANLGVLSEFHWNAMHKACKARALLYAERMFARRPSSPAALWHRAYARGLVGLHDLAVADLDAANNLREAAEDAGERPRWVDVIDAYCRFETDKLAELAKEGDYAQFAGLLQFFHLEGLKESAAVQSLAQELIQRNPEDFRLFDAICDSCAINTLHRVTQLAPAVLHKTIPTRLQQLSGLPPDCAELLNRRGIREVTATELAESLLHTSAADDDGEFSWRILGRMVQEVEFIQLWRRVYFMRFQWAVSADDFIAAIDGIAAGHPYRPLIDLCSTDARRWETAAEALASRLELEEIDYPQQRAFQKAMAGAWQTRWTEQYVQAERRPAMHADDVHRDLLQQMERENWHAPVSLSRRLLKVSSGSPDAVAAKFRHSHGITPEERAALEQKFAGSPQIWKVLGGLNLPFEEQTRVLRQYIKLSPDTWAYQRLAAQFQKEGKIDEWKATLDECLQQPEFGLEHAQLRVQMANYYMDRREWEAARPYAEEAAQTWAEWAMLCAIRCYRGLGDDKQEGVWRARVVERYPKPQHSLDLYVWSRRTGLGDADRLFRAVDPMIAAAANSTAPESQYMIGLFYQLSERPREALIAYRHGADGHRDARQTCFDSLWTATLAEQLGETEIRDQALERVAKIVDPAVAPFRKLAEWAQGVLAMDKRQAPDLARVREIAAAASPNNRTGVNCFIARFLDLRGRQDEALDFYRAALAEPSGRFSATYSYICAVLRDRGLDPSGEHKQATKPTAEKPAGNLTDGEPSED